MKKSLIYLDSGHLVGSLELLEITRRIFAPGTCESYAVEVSNDPQYMDIGEGIFDYHIKLAAECGKYDIRNMADCIAQLHQQYDFDCILIPATITGRMLAPRLAMRVGAGLVADVTGVERKGDVIEMIRPAFDGKILAAITSESAKPVMMSVRPNVFRYVGEDYDSPAKTKRITIIPKTISKSGVVLLESKPKKKISDIRESEILVSGGGGVVENFGRLDELAKELNAMVSASRRIVDSGIASRVIQVGQSGKIVSPKLYVALGIYGSLQHIEGLNKVENIIAVNTSKDAPLCSLADIVVEGDAVEFIEKLVNKIKTNKQNKEDIQ